MRRGDCKVALGVSQGKAMSRQRPRNTRTRRKSEKSGTLTREALLHATQCGGPCAMRQSWDASKRANTKILEGQRFAKTRLKATQLPIVALASHPHSISPSVSSPSSYPPAFPHRPPTNRISRIHPSHTAPLARSFARVTMSPAPRTSILPCTSHLRHLYASRRRVATQAPHEKKRGQGINQFVCPKKKIN
jgi:hypothetical protein